MGSRGKVFLDDAVRAGWTGEIEAKGDGREIVSCIYAGNGMRIVMVWDGTRYNDKESYRTNISGEKRAVRNAAAARRLLTEASGIKIEDGGRAQKSRPIKLADDFDTPDQEIRPAAKPLPFDTGSSDREIFDAVRGKEIVWWSESGRCVQSARVMDKRPQNHMSIVNKRGRRILNWAAFEEGFRSVYLNNILEIRP